QNASSERMPSAGSPRWRARSLIAFQASFGGSACAFSHRLTVETVTAISWANSSCVMLSCWRRVRMRLRVLSAMPATRATDVPRDTRPRARPHVAGAAAERRKAGGPTKTRRALLARRTMTSLWRPHDLRSRGTRGGRRQDGRARRAGAHGLAASRRGTPAGAAPLVLGARPRHRRELSGRLAHRRPRLGGLGRARGAHLERRRVASTRRDGPAGRDGEDPPAGTLVAARRRRPRRRARGPRGGAPGSLPARHGLALPGPARGLRRRARRRVFPTDAADPHDLGGRLLGGRARHRPPPRGRPAAA